MWSASVVPMPSSSGTPKWDVNRRCRSAGSDSPADAATRTDASVAAGSPASSMAA